MYDMPRLHKYFERIKFFFEGEILHNFLNNPTIQGLETLQKFHLASVPFESVSLHYSQTRLLSLDKDDLFEKIVVKQRGGYCMEVNAFFRNVLLGLGYTLISAGARVNGPGGYNGLTHMVNIVTLNGNRHLVDVAFGSNSPLRPIPLESGIVFDGVGEQKGKLEYRALAQHSDKDQRIWVYSTQETRQASWKEQYCFMDIEFFPADFEVMNLSTMTSPRGIFVKTVVASIVVLDAEGEPCGKVTLNQDYLRIRENGEDNVRKLETEEDRVAALEKHFGIHLSTKETEAIRGLPSELKHKAAGADF